MIDLKDQLQKGLKAHQAGDVATATSTYRQILRVDGSHADALHLLGVVHLQSGKHAEAIDLIEQAVQADPSNPIYRNNLGTSYRGMNRFDRAIESFGEALKLNPEYAQAWYNRGCSCEAQKMWEEAAGSYRETLKRMPEFSQAWNNLGNVLLKLESPAEARLCFLELTRLQPESPEAYFNLGNTEFALDDLEAAEKAYEIARRLNPELSGLNFSLGQLAHQRGNLQDAVKYYEAELERSPENAKSLLNLGCALHEAGDSEGALRRYQQSAVGLAESCLAAAHKLLAEENYAAAAEKFDKALELTPDDLSGTPSLPHRAICRFEIFGDQFFVAEVGVQHSLTQGPSQIEHPLSIGTKFTRDSNAVIGSLADQIAHADSRQQADADPAGVRRPFQSDDGNSHPQRFASRRRTVVGKGIQCDIDAVVHAQMVRRCRDLTGQIDPDPVDSVGLKFSPHPIADPGIHEWTAFE